MGFQEAMAKFEAFIKTKADDLIYGLLAFAMASVLRWYDKLSEELWVVVILTIPAIWGGRAIVSGLAQASAAKAAMRAFVAGAGPSDGQATSGPDGSALPGG